jgi:SAM-dependent methyltransferase
VKNDLCLSQVPATFKERTVSAVDVVGFYDRHPINEAAVLGAVARRRGGVELPLRAEDLFDFDQDHYGGLPALTVLARRAGVTAAARVLDVCAGLAGPARFLAWRYGCRVTALELHPGRAAGAARLTRRVGLGGLVAVVRGDAAALPFARASFDACLAQEGFLHVRAKARLLAECRRVLRPGGRLAFTDWIARPRLADAERRRLEAWMAATALPSLDGYRTLLGAAGFHAVEAEDVSDEWRPILARRLETYRAMRGDLVARWGPTGYEDFLGAYLFFVRLVEDGKLGGARLSGTA